MKNKIKAGNRNRTAERHYGYSLRGNKTSSLSQKMAQKYREREICHTLKIGLVI